MESIFGGVLIGVSVSLMLLFNGKITGVSGILGRLLDRSSSDKSWRILFVLGLILGGAILKISYPVAFEIQSSAVTMDYILGGLVVGIGTTIGSGCTSGHGVCGISRLSKRSIIATMTFMAFGVLSVILFKVLRGGL